MASKTKFTGWLAGLAGAIAATFIATNVGKSPHKPAPPTPVEAHYTLTVHLFEGDPAKDEKVVGADLTLHQSATLLGKTDEAGNYNYSELTAGAYTVCAVETKIYPLTCVDVQVPAQTSVDISVIRVAAPTPRIFISGRFFATEAGTFRPRFQSGLTLLVRSDEERDAFLDETLRLGFNGIRVFAGELGWAGQTAEMAEVKLPALYQAAASRGLYVYVSALTGTGFDAESHLQKIASTMPENGILEVANEVGHPTQSLIGKDPIRLLTMARRVIPAEVTWTLGSWVESDELMDGKYPTDGGKFNDAHLDRGRDTWNQVRRLREIAAISETTKKPAMSGEPIGADEMMGGITGNKQRRNDPPFFFAMGALCRGFELGCVFHSEAGLQGHILGPNQLLCAQAFIEGWNSVDNPDRLQFFNTGWMGSPVLSANFEHGLVRAYSFVAGNHGWTVLVGVNGDPGVNWGNGWHPVDIIAERPGVQVFGITK